MNKKLALSLALGGVIRYLLSISKYSKSIENRVEVSTPLNSFKRRKLLNSNSQISIKIGYFSARRSISV